MRWRKQSLVWCQYTFLALGLLSLGYCAKTLTQAWLYQRWSQQQVRVAGAKSSERASHIRSETATPVAGSVARPATEELATSSRELSPIARLEIPRVHIFATVAEGTLSRVLSRAVGHAAGTALPGQAGNITLAAHRDTFFRHLGDVRFGDEIDLKEQGQEYRYQVRFTAVVGPKDTWVLQPSGTETLTLVTCYPFRFVGPAPERFVVRARRIHTDEQ